MSDGIVFQVETTRVLEILTREIYDSPFALLRENLQNAYDAVRMRFAAKGELEDGGRIEIQIEEGMVSISDNGIGMNEETLRENFWKTGASGKHSDAAKRAGVVGTFGIGAMANFGVCNTLTVETRAEGQEMTLRSVAERNSLKIAEECISLERVEQDRGVGTTVTALLDAEHRISVNDAKQYLLPYVSMLPVPVLLNGELISSQSPERWPPIAERTFVNVGSSTLSDVLCGATFHVRADSNWQILVHVSQVTLGGNAVEGEMFLLQNGGQLFGQRFSFGLAPIPSVGNYQFGGFANLSFLQPTAGREALSRESIDQVVRLVALAELATSEAIADTPGADRNTGFLQWLIAHGRYELASGVTVRLLPNEKEVPLGEIRGLIGTRLAYYYGGNDSKLLMTFANENSYVLHLAQSNPRRKVQLHYVQQTLRIPEIPDSAQVTKIYKASDLTVREASVLLRITSILREDYLVAEADVLLAEISHGVVVLPQKEGNSLRVFIARSSALLPPLLEFYDRAYDLFTQFMKDFVRVHIYPRIQDYVPSSTRDGVDALRRLLQRNRELYRYEEAERGDLEGILGDYLSGATSLSEVLNTVRSRARPQSQSVSREQVGSIENELPNVVESPVIQAPMEGAEFAPSPPIIRSDVISRMKILTTQARYPQLNNFRMLLGLSDKLMMTHADFFHAPHTTRILWGGHRVVYIFSEATERLSLYYDIELRDPIGRRTAGGGMFPTTTLISKSRIFVPVPDDLADEFEIGAGPKEFFVRFDILTSDIA